MNSGISSATIKRLMDVTVSALLLLLLSPILLFLAFLIRRKIGLPILFRQKRTGLNGKTFEILKFRTMSNTRDKNGKLLADKQRLCSFGQALRKLSIDELPELINVLRGEMSLVGPRPLLPEYLPLYDKFQMRRHEVLPGITGWAQINGRNAITWQKKFELDVWYVDNRTFMLDIKILFLTLWKVLRKEGVSQPGHETVEPFRGNDDI
ncbi:MAG: sugar transferase [Candidatus Rifleibacteriota bacterium]